MIRAVGDRAAQIPIPPNVPSWSTEADPDSPLQPEDKFSDMYQRVLDREYLPSLEELHELAGSSHHQPLAGQVNARWQEYQCLKPNSFEAAMAHHGAVPSFSVPIRDIEQHSLPNPRFSAEDRALMKKSKMGVCEMGAIVLVTKEMLQMIHHACSY